MTRRNSNPIVAMSLMTSCIVASAQGLDGMQGRSCGTPEPPLAEVVGATREARPFLESSARFRVSRVKVTIPVAVHVIHNNGAGNVPESLIDKQLFVLNQVLGPVGFEFTKHSVTRTNNAAWYRMISGDRTEADAKRGLAVDHTQVLNMYIAKPRGWTEDSAGAPVLEELLGFATFPWWLETQEFDPKLDGVVLDHESLPDARAWQFDLGYTAIHEVGHWLGLLHTFHGGGANASDSRNGCQDPGDEVADTPFEFGPNRGPGYRKECPMSVRSVCPTGGLNPIHNFMNYSDDKCMTELTPGQDYRALNMTQRYRSEFVDRSPSVVKFRATFGR